MYFRAAVAALAGMGLWAARDALWRLPFPYEAIPIQPLSDARHQRLLAGLAAAANGPLTLPTPASGSYIPLEDRSTRLFQGTVVGAESVEVSPSGRLAMLDRYGYVHLATPNTVGGYTLQADQGPLYIGPGRPLGSHFVTEDTLLVCDSLKGLIEVNLTSRTLRTLTNAVGGAPLHYANDLDVTSDRKVVYFSSSTRGPVALDAALGYYDTLRSFLLNLYSADATGRLLRYSYETGTTELVMDELFYANGVALGPNEDFVAVVESSGLRVLRKWLKGPKAGTVDVLIGDLPGFPDGISRSSDGNFWLCLVAPITPIVKVLQPAAMRLLLAHLSVTLGLSKVLAKPLGCVLKVSPSGEILAAHVDPTGQRISTVSAATEHEGHLFLGNLNGDFITVVRLQTAADSGAATSAK